MNRGESVLSSYKKSLKDMFDDLDSAEKFLRNRRMFSEADAVKFAREILLEEAYEAVQDITKWDKVIDMDEIKNKEG